MSGGWFAALPAVLEVALILIALIVAPRGRRPESAIAWILLIVVLPIIGVVLFALVGSPRLPRRRREAQQRMNERIALRSATTTARSVVVVEDLSPTFAGIVRLNQSVGALPALSGNAAQLLPHFEEQLPALIEAIDEAERYAHVEFYILALDDTTAPFFRALERAVQRGVEVRVMLDHLGTAGYPGFRRATRELDRIGAHWRLMLPIRPLRGQWRRPDLRDHRKLMIVDGKVGFTGSLNLIDPGYERSSNARRGLRWRDLLVRVEGPAVQEIDALFVTDWFSETGVDLPTAADPAPLERRVGDLVCQIAPSGPAFPYENNLALFNSLLYSAHRRISITSPYFVPDESLLAAITAAARRGVEVELFIGAIGDQFFVFHAQHSYYAPLLEAGVRIWQYPAPNILHAKHVSIDDDVAVVGSSNMDVRSFQLDLEISLLVQGESFCSDLRRVEDEYRSMSTELTAEEWARRGRVHEVVDNLARLTSAIQ